MSTNSPINLKTIDAFENITQSSLDSIYANLQYFEYELGQPICSNKALPNIFQVILEGEARLISESGGKAYSIGKLQKGSFVGIASLLGANPCEEVSASSYVKTLAIKDELFLELFEQDSIFKRWCNTTLQISEFHNICSKIKSISSNPKEEIRDLFLGSIASARVRAISNKGKVEEDSEYEWFVDSNNLANHKVGDIVSYGSVLMSKGPLPIRLVGVKKDYLHSNNKTNANIDNKTGNPDQYQSTDFETIKAPHSPEYSGLDLGQYTGDKNISLIRANGSIEEARACLQMLANQLNLPFRKDSIDKILRDYIQRKKEPSIDLCGALAGMLGLQSFGAEIPSEFITRLQTPSIINWQNGFAVLSTTNSKQITLASPKDGWVTINSEEISDKFGKTVKILLVEKSNATPERKFGFEWFWPVIKKYRGVLFQVFLASFVVQLFGLANPLLIQVIIDKVINQRSMDTLQILGYALVVVTILGGFIGSLRTFLFTEATNRIDTKLGSEVIDHMLRLPLNYFDRRPVGELGTRIAELEKIRNFLTGQALTTVLDAAYSIIYIIVMLFYSTLLSFVALAVVPIQVALTLIGAPLIRRQAREVAEKNALTQSHLIEVITGIQTVKAQNVETISRWKWQGLYNKYITQTFEKTIAGTALNETSNVLQQLSQLLVLWVGSTLVLNGELTLGQLIAFRIISGYVTQPLLRLSNIWQNIQELKVSFDRLADIVDTPEESSDADKANIPLPSIKGKVEFQELDFSFKRNSANVLNNISLTINPGTFVGIVGQSGSGKSTLMKLLPRLYSPNKGKILIDGYDISKVELYSLRRQIGMVPQDPLLFAGSVSDNISLTDPECDSDDIVKASKIANAHDFVMSLPLGYSTDVGERGAALSGGQRQRLAIARTLLIKPNLLVMDEATSALDYETERKVCDNLREECKNITVFFITHRLSTIKNADVIIMMHQGSVAEIGTHDYLMSIKGRYYALSRQQNSN